MHGRRSLTYTDTSPEFLRLSSTPSIRLEAPLSADELHHPHRCDTRFTHPCYSEQRVAPLGKGCTTASPPAARRITHNARSHLPVLTEHTLPPLRNRFHVKPTQNHRIGIMAARPSSRSSHPQEWTNRCPSVNALRARYNDENPHLMHDSTLNHHRELRPSLCTPSADCYSKQRMRYLVLLVLGRGPVPPPGKGLTQRFSSASVEPLAHEHRIHLMNLNGSIPPSALSRFHVKPPQHKRITHGACSVWLEEPSGLLQASVPTDDAWRNTHSAHSVADLCDAENG